MMGKDLNSSWLDFQGSANNFSLLTSSTIEDEDHDATFAPPNSPIVPSSNVLVRSTINIPNNMDQTLNADDHEGASPIVRGVLDSTWFPYPNYENGPMTPDTNYPTNGSVYPYFSYRHDLTFRDLQLASSLPNGSNNFLNESNFEMFHTSLLDSNRKTKSKKPMFDQNGGALDERKQLDYELYSNNNNNNNNNSALEPMFQIFREIKPKDSHLSHIVSNIKRLLTNGIVSSSDVCAEDFVKKSGELFQNSSQFDDEIAIFHLVSLFEQVLGDPDLEKDSIHLITRYCRSPLGKLALAGNPEISKRAENCLTLLL